MYQIEKKKAQLLEVHTNYIHEFSSTYIPLHYKVALALNILVIYLTNIDTLSIIAALQIKTHTYTRFKGTDGDTIFANT